jgi:hypothetical protein
MEVPNPEECPIKDPEKDLPYTRQVTDSEEVKVSQEKIPKSHLQKCGHKHTRGVLHFVKCEGHYRREGFDKTFSRICKRSFCLYCYQVAEYVDPITGTPFVYIDGFFPYRKTFFFPRSTDRLYDLCVDCDLFFKKRKTNMSFDFPKTIHNKSADKTQTEMQEDQRAREFAFSAEKDPKAAKSLHRYWFNSDIQTGPYD